MGFEQSNYPVTQQPSIPNSSHHKRDACGSCGVRYDGL